MLRGAWICNSLFYNKKIIAIGSITLLMYLLLAIRLTKLSISKLAVDLQDAKGSD